MKKNGLLYTSVISLLIVLAGCTPVTPLTSSELASRDRLLIKENSNSAQDNSDRFDITIPNTYEADLKYSYKDYYDHNYFTIDSTPSVGNLNLLVVPVRLQNYNLEDENKIRDEIYTAYFGDEDDIDFESITTYFNKSSYGNLSIGGYVTDWYDAPYDSTISQDETSELVIEVCDWAKRVYKDLIDFSSLDSDKDGYLDAVCMIYNTPNSYRGNDNLWAYSSWIYNVRPSINNPQPRNFFWASYDFMHENTVHTDLDAHTYIHETGHLIGLDDYYDYSKLGYAGASGGGIMESHNVGDHDPYSKMALGWIDPLVVNGECEITLKPFSTSGQTVVLTNREGFESPFDEYILIDFYSNDNLNYYDSQYKYAGNNASTPLLPEEQGIRIWHIDARLANYDDARRNYTISNEIHSGGHYYHLNSNSSSGSHAALDPDNRDYRLLHLIQKGFYNSYENKKGEFFSGKDLFIEGDTFSVDRYKALMPNKDKLNDNSSLNYSVEIISINENEAKIKVEVL